MKKLIALLMLPFIAQAHVTLESNSAAPAGYAKIVFRVPHGCDGSATTKLTVKLPEGVLSVKPQVHVGWKVKTTKVKLATPVKSNGKDITETLSEITWEGGNLSDEYMDEFGVSLKLPDEAGEKLIFPVIQTCKKRREQLG